MSVSRPRLEESGYSLAELLAVLVILTGVSAVVMANMPQQAKMTDTRTAAMLVAQGLNTSRSDAIARHQTQNVLIDVAQRSVHVSALREPIALHEDLKVSLVVAAEAGVTRTRGAITFFPDGSSSGGRVTLSSETGAHDVVVDWLTGLVRVEEVD